VYFTKWRSDTSQRIVAVEVRGLPHHGRRARPIA
jgi:hypothetical protein